MNYSNKVLFLSFDLKLSQIEWVVTSVFSFHVMVCGDAVLLDFWCGFAEIFILFLFLFAVLQFYETKRFAVFRIQCGLRFSYAGAPVLCYSLRFLNVCLCCYAVFLTPPPPLQTLTPPSNFDLKTELGHYKISPDRTTSTPRDAN